MSTLEITSMSRLCDVEGNVPLAVAIWLEHHPTAVLATALATSAPTIRWLFRVSPSVEVVLRGPRVEIVDVGTAARIGTARIRGVRSAGDFDALPRALEPPPFAPPEVSFPVLCGFACDLDGRVARFQPSEGAGISVAPGLLPRATSYPHVEPRIDDMIAALAVAHSRPSYRVTAFAARVRDLVRVLQDTIGSARFYSWFEDERVIVWPAGASPDLVSAVLFGLHGQHACLGCSRFDPRDAFRRGTYGYARTIRSEPTTFSRDDVPDAPMDIAAAAALLSRTPAELAATQLPVRFESAMRVDLSKIRRAS
jgi:hypothetical protein